MKKYDIFENEKEMNKHLKYWSNACGELHHHGEYDLTNISELPEELQRAYKELWEEWNGCLEYLEFDDTFANDNGLSMDELYERAKSNALKLYEKELFLNTFLVIGKETGFDGCHEICFLVPATESKNTYDEIESEIYLNMWEINKN